MTARKMAKRGSAVEGAGRGTRGDKYTLYFKSKERISDALVYMGATKAALAVQKEIVDSYMGRRAAAAQNCDVANIDRAVEAAVIHPNGLEPYVSSLHFSK